MAATSDSATKDSACATAFTRKNSPLYGIMVR